MPEQFSLDLSPAKKSAPRVLYFDLETKKSAGEVGGWGNINKMGMACAVLYDTLDEAYHVYDEKDVQDLITHLQKADLIVGFNHIRFDYTVLNGYSSTRFSDLPNLDMLVEVEKIIGHRLKLNSLVASTLGETKSADGLQSLQWVKEGKMDLVREYCKKDVEVTRNLFEHGAREGFVCYEKMGDRVKIPVQWNTDQLIRAQKERGSTSP